MNWQPIDTAPKDETFFLAWCQNYSEVPEVIRWDREFSKWMNAEAQFIATFTHWMPLPDPPPKDNP